MPDYCRELVTNIQVEYFVDGILCIEGDEEKDAAINLITQAERNMKDYRYFPTLTHRDNRNYKFRDDTIRNKLRAQIVNELFEKQRLDNDDDIKIECGGACPQTECKSEGKAFYIIGSPATGKSGIAAKIADAFGCYILDSDYAKRKLPEYTDQIGSASLVHAESDELIFGKDGLAAKCLENKYNIVVPKIGHKIESILSLCNFFKSAGYQIYLISIDLDRQKATQRAYNRFKETRRYVPLSLVFDGYSNQATLNYFKIKQLHSDIFSGFAQISTDVPRGKPVELIETYNLDELNRIDWR